MVHIDTLVKSRLRTYIKNLSIEEVKQFKDFVLSPYFNKSSRLSHLLAIIVGDIEEEIKEKTKKRLDDLYPAVKDENNRLRKDLTKLKKLFLRFLSCEELGTKPFDEDIFAIKKTLDRGWTKLLEIQLTSLEKKLNNCKNINADYYLAKYRYYSLLSNSQVLFGNQPDVKLQEQFDSFSKYSQLEVLKLKYVMLTHANRENVEYDFKFFELLTKYIESNYESYKDEGTINLYHSLITGLNNLDDVDTFERLNEFLSIELDTNERRALYYFLVNFCIKKINSGEYEFHKKLFALYKRGVEHKEIFVKGQISQFEFKNIVTNAIRLKKFDWVESFIKDNVKRLPPNIRDNAYHYSIGYVYYHKEMYDKALDNLRLVKFTDLEYRIATVYLLCIIYYSRNDIEALLSLIETFGVFLRRNTVMATESKIYHRTFLRFVKKLTLLKQKTSSFPKDKMRKKLEELRENIERSKMVRKDWVLSECSKLLEMQR